MMKKKILSLVLALALCLSLLPATALAAGDFSQTPSISVNRASLDFGTVVDCNEMPEIRFNVTNISDIPVKVRIVTEAEGRSYFAQGGERRWNELYGSYVKVSISSNGYIKPGETAECVVRLPQVEDGELTGTITLVPQISDMGMTVDGKPVTLALSCKYAKSVYDLRSSYDHRPDAELDYYHSAVPGSGKGQILVDGVPLGYFDPVREVPAGGSVKIEIKPYDPSAWHVSDFLINGESMGAVTSYTLTMEYDTYINAVFSPGPASGDQQQSQQPENPPASAEEPSLWAKGLVDRAVALNILPPELQTGYNLPTTRAQFCILADRLYTIVKGSPAPLNLSVAFQDTSDPAVLRMASIGVVNGTGGDSFSPDQSMTREQAATMLSRLASVLGTTLPSQTPSFDDSGSISSWASSATGQMQASGIMSGVGNNQFDPQGSYSWEQSIATIIRLHNTVTGG